MKSKYFVSLYTIFNYNINFPISKNQQHLNHLIIDFTLFLKVIFVEKHNKFNYYLNIPNITYKKYQNIYFYREYLYNLFILPLPSLTFSQFFLLSYLPFLTLFFLLIRQTWQTAQVHLQYLQNQYLIY